MENNNNFERVNIIDKPINISEFNTYLNSKNYSKTTIKLYQWMFKRYFSLYGEIISEETIRKFPLEVGTLEYRENYEEYKYKEQQYPRTFMRHFIQCFYPNRLDLLTILLF